MYLPSLHCTDIYRLCVVVYASATPVWPTKHVYAYLNSTTQIVFRPPLNVVLVGSGTLKSSSTDSAEVLSTVQATCSIRRWISVVCSLKQPYCNSDLPSSHSGTRSQNQSQISTSASGLVPGQDSECEATAWGTLPYRESAPKQMKRCDEPRTQMHSNSRSSMGDRRPDAHRWTAARGHQCEARSKKRKRWKEDPPWRKKASR
jgi:hypothetical protein